MGNKYLVAFVALLLIALMIALTDPFMVLMPAPVAMLCLLLAAALVLVFAGFVLFEGARDEREAVHRMRSGRAAYIAGLSVLGIGFVTQGLTHHIDPWIPAALAAMIIAKLAARFWSDAKN